MLPSHGPWGGRCRPRDWGPGGGGEPGRGSRNLCWEERRGSGVRSAPFPRLPPPPGAGGAGAESAQPRRWMNVGENGDQDDRIRLGHVGGADGGKSGPHPLPPSAGREPPPHKAGPKLEAPEGRGRGGLFLIQPLPPVFAIWGTEPELPRMFAAVSPTRRPRFALLRLQPTPFHCTGRPPHPLLVGPFVLPPARPGTKLRASRSRALESPTVHTRKWREGNRAPSPHPPTLILPIWKELFSLLCCRSAVRVGSPWFRGPRGSGSSLDGRKEDKRGERGG